MLSILLITIEQFVLYLPLILGAFISFSLLKIPNLCLESAFLTGGICAHTVLITVPTLPAVIKLLIGTAVGLTSGALVGLVCGLIITRGRIAHLLANILTVGLFSGFNLSMLNGSYGAIKQEENALTLIPLRQHPELATTALIALACTICIVYILRTPFGKSIIVYGNNPAFFEHHRISTSFVLVGGMVVSNALAGLSSFLISQTNGFLDINGSVGLVVLCITALILGKQKIRVSSPMIIAQPLIGLCMFCFIQQLLLASGLNLKYFTSIASVLVLTIIILTRDSTNRTVPTDQLGV